MYNQLGKKINLQVAFLILSIFGLVFFNFGKNKKIFGSDCDLLIGDKKEECEDLEKKAEDYRKIIELKDKQQIILDNQLQIINLEQQKNSVQLKEEVDRLIDIDNQIQDLEEKIRDNDKLIIQQKNILSSLIRSYHESFNNGISGIIFLGTDFSQLFSQSDYLDQTSSKINEILQSIIQIKKNLEKNIDEINEKKNESEKAKESLAKRGLTLQSNQDIKQNQKNQAQSDEEKYRERLAKIESQKLELFDFSGVSNLDDVVASVKNYKKPSSKYWASTSWFFYQWDSRWGNKKIGDSNSSMKDWGCAVTSVAMVFKKHGASVDPGKLAGKDSLFANDLIMWPISWYPGIERTSSIYHGNINWSTIDTQIKKGNPVIVYLSRSRGGGHYVVIHNKDSNDYIVHDPYFGSNLYLSTSKSLVGKLGVNSFVKINQMIIYN